MLQQRGVKEMAFSPTLWFAPASGLEMFCLHIRWLQLAVMTDEGLISGYPSLYALLVSCKSTAHEVHTCSNSSKLHFI